MELHTFLSQSGAFRTETEAKSFASKWTPVLVKKGDCLAEQGELETNEHIILDGHVVSRILDPDGGAVCVGLYGGACTITPNVARTSAGMSRVSLVAASDTLVMQVPAQTLLDLMLKFEGIRDWANGVLRTELAHKSEREWCLAALGGADRLVWFRRHYPEYEDIFNHATIASFLGITPVTLSRLRNKAS